MRHIRTLEDSLSLGVSALCGFGDRLADLGVSGAAAEVASKAFFNLIQRGAGLFLQKLRRRHYDSGRADAALRTSAVENGLLQKMQLTGASQSFNRGDAGPPGLQDWDQAAVHQDPIHEDRTRSALPLATAFLRACQTDLVTQDIQ